MPDEQQDALQFDVRGNIFQIDGTRTYDRDNPQPGTLRFNVSNGAGDWIDLVVDGEYPVNSRIWQSGHIGKRARVSHDEDMNLHRNRTVKLTRWRPGVFGIPGNGGGDVRFTLPDSGDVVVNVSVTG